MSRYLLLLILMGIGQATFAQYVYPIKADSVLMTNSCDTTELILENHTQNVPGFLFNKGQGRTEFRKMYQKINDSAFWIGGDTLKLTNIWFQGGNRFGTTGKFGTLDNNPIDFYTNGVKRGQLTSKGHLFINDEEDLDFYFLQVNGDALFRTFLDAGTDQYSVRFFNSNNTFFDGPKIWLGYTGGAIGVNMQDIGNIPANSLLMGYNSPNVWTAMIDYPGNPTFIGQVGGEVAINGGYNGIQSGGAVGNGADAPGHTLKIYGGRGTGAGTPGDINIFTGNAQPSGTTIHSMTTRWIIKGGTGFLSNTPNPTSAVDIIGSNGYSQFGLRTRYSPSSSSAADGNTGDFSWDDNGFYIKTSAGWKQSALASF